MNKKEPNSLKCRKENGKGVFLHCATLDIVLIANTLFFFNIFIIR